MTSKVVMPDRMVAEGAMSVIVPTRVWGEPAGVTCTMAPRTTRVMTLSRTGAVSWKASGVSSTMAWVVVTAGGPALWPATTLTWSTTPATGATIEPLLALCWATARTDRAALTWSWSCCS